MKRTASVLPARESVGAVLIAFLGGDLVAVVSYRHDAHWQHLWRLFPWAGLGVVIGALALGRIPDAGGRRLIGGILLALIIFYLLRQYASRNGDAELIPFTRHPWLIGLTGVLAGFTTMVANASGPIMVLYLLALRLPKVAFIGTAAWFFLCLNLFKLPFSAGLGLATVWFSGATMNAILLTMPSLVYVLAMSGALHLYNYYRETVEEHGLEGGSDRMLQLGWKAAALCSVTTAIGLLCRMYLGWKHENEALKRGVEWVSNQGPSMSGGANMYYNYYGTQVCRQFGDEVWDKWNSKMRDFLVNSQSKDGPAQGSWYFAGGHGAEAGGRLYNTSLATMVLEVYYRHMPIYQQQATKDEFPL
mgnify:CR=1 FL=1